MRSWMITAYPADMFSTWSCLRSHQFIHKLERKVNEYELRRDYQGYAPPPLVRGWHPQTGAGRGPLQGAPRTVALSPKAEGGTGGRGRPRARVDDQRPGNP